MIHHPAISLQLYSLMAHCVNDSSLLASHQDHHHHRPRHPHCIASVRWGTL